MPERVHRDIKASRGRLRVAEAGAGAPIVLLHGLFFFRESWNAVFDALSSEFRVVAPDLPGFGESEKPGPSRFDYTVDTFAHTVADLYAGLHLGPAALIGHGLGGAIAISVAARYPELVSRLILVDALCYPTPRDLTQRVAELPLLGGLAFKQLWGRRAFRNYFKERVFSRDFSVPLERVDRYYDVFNPPAARVSALATLRGTIDTRATIADIARVAVPTLVVWGRHDTIYPVLLGQRLAREIRGAGLELMNTGHAPHEEEPDLFVQIVSRFCRAERAGVRP
jgi:pimeloyl-ACP methyl ester carboxylesterase